MARTVFESQTIPGMRIQKRVKVMPNEVPTHITVMAFSEKPQVMRRIRATFKHFRMDYWTLHASIRAKFNVALDQQLIIEAMTDNGKYIHLTNQEDLIYAVMTSPAGATLVLRISTRAKTVAAKSNKAVLAALKSKAAKPAVAAQKVHRVNVMGSFHSTAVKPYEIEDDRLPSFAFVFPTKTVFRVNKRPSFIPVDAKAMKVQKPKQAKTGHFAAFMTGRVTPKTQAIKSHKMSIRAMPTMFAAEAIAVVAAPKIVRHDAKVQCSAKSVDASTQTMASSFKTTSRPTQTPLTKSVSVGVSTAAGMDAIVEEDLEATLVPQTEDDAEMIESVLAWNCVIDEESRGYKLAVSKVMQNEEEAAGYDFADM